MIKLTLAKVLAIPAVQAGEIELHMRSAVIRGPIESVVRHEREASFLLKWSAILDKDGDWVWTAFRQIDLPRGTCFFQVDYGMIIIYHRNFLTGMIYPVGTGRLDPKIVFHPSQKYKRKRNRR